MKDATELHHGKCRIPCHAKGTKCQNVSASAALISPILFLNCLAGVPQLYGCPILNCWSTPLNCIISINNATPTLCLLENTLRYVLHL